MLYCSSLDDRNRYQPGTITRLVELGADWCVPHKHDKTCFYQSTRPYPRMHHELNQAIDHRISIVTRTLWITFNNNGDDNRVFGDSAGQYTGGVASELAAIVCQYIPHVVITDCD